MPAPGVSVAAGAACGQDCSSTKSCVQSAPLGQIFRVNEVFSWARQITICRPLNVSTVVQPASGPGVDRDAASVTVSNVTVSGRTRTAWAIPSMQYWHSNKIVSAPVTGTPGVCVVAVCVVSVAAGEAVRSTVAVVSKVAVVSVVAVSAVPVVSVSTAGGEAVRSPGIGVPTAGGDPSSDAQAASTSTNVNAPNQNSREIFSFFFLLTYKVFAHKNSCLQVFHILPRKAYGL
jgi:hypothetical protein